MTRPWASGCGSSTRRCASRSSSASYADRSARRLSSAAALRSRARRPVARGGRSSSEAARAKRRASVAARTRPRSAPRPDVRGAMLLLDVDRLKDLNSPFLNSGADDILRGIFEIVRGAVPADTAYRLGGDEAGVLLPGMSLKQTKSIGHDPVDGGAHVFLTKDAEQSHTYGKHRRSQVIPSSHRGDIRTACRTSTRASKGAPEHPGLGRDRRDRFDLGCDNATIVSVSREFPERRRLSLDRRCRSGPKRRIETMTTSGGAGGN